MNYLSLLRLNVNCNITNQCTGRFLAGCVRASLSIASVQSPVIGALGVTLSIKHLQLLQKALEDKKWFVVKELSGNDYDVSAYWEIARPGGSPSLLLSFEGLDDMNTYPIEKSYGCHVVGNRECGLYFGKVGKSFKLGLISFPEAIPNNAT